MRAIEQKPFMVLESGMGKFHIWVGLAKKKISNI